MLELMTAIQYGEWQTYFNEGHLGEFPDDRADHRAAIIAATFANVMRPKNSRAMKLEDFLPQFSDGTETPATLYHSMGKIARQRRGRKATTGDQPDGKPTAGT